MRVLIELDLESKLTAAELSQLHSIAAECGKEPAEMAEGLIRSSLHGLADREMRTAAEEAA